MNPEEALPLLDSVSAFPVDHVLHPTDFSPASQVAFIHALAIALRARAALTVLHIDRKADPTPWNEFPPIRTTLERWALLPHGSPKDAVPKLGIKVEKVAFGTQIPCIGFSPSWTRILPN